MGRRRQPKLTPAVRMLLVLHLLLVVEVEWTVDRDRIFFVENTVCRREVCVSVCVCVEGGSKRNDPVTAVVCFAAESRDVALEAHLVLRRQPNWADEVVRRHEQRDRVQHAVVQINSSW